MGEAPDNSPEEGVYTEEGGGSIAEERGGRGSKEDVE